MIRRINEREFWMEVVLVQREAVDVKGGVRKQDETAERRSISMYPEDWQVVEAVASQLRIGVSGALRTIVQTWSGVRIKGNDSEQTGV